MTSVVCQRWQNHQPVFLRAEEGGFNSTLYSVEVIDASVARAYVEEHHYSGSFPAAQLSFGLFHHSYDHDALVGVAVYAVPVSKRSLTNVFPDLEPYVESTELSRLVLEGDPGISNAAYADIAGRRAPANAESWFIARCHEHLAARGFQGVLSFSDPVARTTATGDVVLPGHIGVVYQASNAVYLGRGTARTLKLMPDGTSLNERSLQKVRKGESGAAYTVERLVAAGATPPVGNQDLRLWLPSALTAAGVRDLRHGGAHRYAFRLGATKAAKRRVHIAGEPEPYPKAA